MAMTYVMVFEDITPRHPVCRLIAKKTGDTPRGAFGALVSFWQWADKLTEDGFIPSVDASDVDYAVDLEGFAAALSSYGAGDPWIRFDERGLHIHNYNSRGGTSTKQRAKDNVRRAMARSEEKPSPPPPTPVRKTPDKPRTDGGQESATSFESESENEITSSSSPKTAAKEAEEALGLREEGGDWHAIYVDVVNAGVGNGAVAVSSAKRSGWTAALARDVIAHYRKKAKQLGGPAALFRRFTERGPEFAPSKGWFKPETEPPDAKSRDPAVQREMDIRAVMQGRGVSKAEAIEIVDAQALTA